MFEGIIGTVIGSVATLITTHFLKSIGKISFYFRDWKLVCYKQDEYGNMVETDLCKAQYCEYSVAIQIYNGAETYKILRDIFIEFKTSDGRYNSIPNDRNTMKSALGCIKYEPLTVINLAPKQITEIPIIGSIDVHNLLSLKEVYFTAHDHRGKDLKKLIISYDKPQ